MNATRNETRRDVANGFGESGKRNVKRWSEIFLTAFDALALAALWSVFASTLVCFAPFFSTSRAVCEARIASTLVFLTFATVSVYVLRETVCVWRESPCRLPKSEFRARVRSASFPLWATAAVVAAFGATASGTTDGESNSAFATACATVVYVFCVDVGAAFFARRWGATVARDWRLALEGDTTSLKEKKSPDVDATFETKTVSGDGQGGAQAANETPDDAFDEANAEFEVDGELLATQRRVRTEEGGTQIFGSVAVEFEADASVAPVCVAFCPPFEGVPSFAFEQAAGPEIALDATSVQPFGVRLEAKRRVAQPSDSQGVASDETIRIEYFAAFPPFDETDEKAP